MDFINIYIYRERERERERDFEGTLPSWPHLSHNGPTLIPRHIFHQNLVRDVTLDKLHGFHQNRFFFPRIHRFLQSNKSMTSYAKIGIIFQAFQKQSQNQTNLFKIGPRYGHPETDFCENLEKPQPPYFEISMDFKNLTN